MTWWPITWATSRSTSNEYGVPVPNLHRVVAGRLYRGGRPPLDAYAELAAATGTRTVVSLLRSEDAPLLEDRGAARAAGLTWSNVPMSDKATPTDEQIREVLAIIRAPACFASFVHCHGRH